MLAVFFGVILGLIAAGWIMENFKDEESIEKNTVQKIHPRTLDTSLYSISSKENAFWDPVKGEHTGSLVRLNISCKASKDPSIALFVLEDLKPTKNTQAIIRIETGNLPPSRTGYKKFIYTASYISPNFYITERKNDFLRDLNSLRIQAFENQKKAFEEYDEKMEYCNKEPEDRRQKCFQSSSGYQDQEPHILLEIEWKKKESTIKKQALFLAKSFQNINCF